MSYWLYSEEAFPAMQVKTAVPGLNLPALSTGVTTARTPEYIQWNGFTISPVPARQWVELPRTFERTIYSSDKDLSGQRIVTLDSEMAEVVNKRWSERGIVVVPEDVKKTDQQKLETFCHDQNVEFRKRSVDEFERQLNERKVTGKGRAWPTQYEIECYELLDLPKPWSHERPGDAAAATIANAIRDALLDSSLKSSAQNAALYEGEPKV